MIRGVKFIRRFFRSPKVIIGELVAMAGTCAVGALLGQDRLFHNVWFMALTAAVALSLTIVIHEQLRRLTTHWGSRPAVRLIGSPLFHFGLLLVISAGFCRLLFGTEAVVDLMEGETLAATPASWSGQQTGVFGKPFRLPCPVTMNTLYANRYEDGDLRDLAARITLHERDALRGAELSVNRDITTATGRLFLGADFGPAALLEWQKEGAPSVHEAVLLTDCGQGLYEGSSSGSNGLQAHVRTFIGRTVKHPESFEVRVMRGHALLSTGRPRVGQTVALHNGESMVIVGSPFWARVRGTHDPALGVAYAGFALVIAGAVMMFGMTSPDYRRASA